MLKRCEICGRTFDARRSTARFCTSTCRSRYNRALGVGVSHGMRRDAPQITVEEVGATLRDAHSVASDLSRASQFGPTPLRAKCAAAALAIETALRDSGL